MPNSFSLICTVCFLFASAAGYGSQETDRSDSQYESACMEGLSQLADRTEFLQRDLAIKSSQVELQQEMRPLIKTDSKSVIADSNLVQEGITSTLWPVSHLVQEPSKEPVCGCSAGAKAEAEGRRGKDVVIMLAQNNTRPGHSAADFEANLRTFYAHVNDCLRKDVIIFHNGDFTEDGVAAIRRRFGPELQFHLLADGGPWWRPPPSVNISEQHTWYVKHAPLGYRNMCRFHSILIYDYLASLGYEWFMRIDEDSSFLSCIDYDLFGFLESQNRSIGYRVAYRDAEKVIRGLPELTRRFLQVVGKEPQPQLRQHIDGTLEELSSHTWDRFVYYNNFFMTKISAWRQPLVQKFLDQVDQSGIIYTHKVGDAPVQTMAALALMPESAVYRFDDWGYHHCTVDRTRSGCLIGAYINKTSSQLNICRQDRHQRISWGSSSEIMAFCGEADFIVPAPGTMLGF